MFVIGEKVVYPMYGAGVIETIEESEILGEKKSYYVLKIPCRDIKIMIPVDHCDCMGVRPVIAPDKIAQVVQVLKGDSSDMPSNWNRRVRENTEKLKSGSIEQVAEVVRNLMRVDRHRKLSAGEKKMLVNARQILISEFVLVCDMEQEAVTSIIDAAV